jgi:hypothetical protein
MPAEPATMTSDYAETSRQISCYLARVQKDDGSFPARASYGEAFAGLLWSRLGAEFRENASKAIHYTANKPRVKVGGYAYPWEFINYALLSLGEEWEGLLPFPHSRLKFTGIRLTNWSLLRALCRIKTKETGQVKEGLREISQVLARFQRGGLIYDDLRLFSRSKSLQYHSYSAALLAEAYEETRQEWLLEAFLDAANYISRFVLANGDSLYVGRGQEQSFGYGALVYVLERAASLTGESSLANGASRAFRFLKGFQRSNGSFPLVLRGGENGYPAVVDPSDERFLGWYSYNHYFDYLPFLGYYLLAASQAAGHRERGIRVTDESHPVQDFSDGEFMIHRGKSYNAVVSRPCRRWSDNMPVPYVCWNGVSLMPCCGGEQARSSLYSPQVISLPFGFSDNRIWFTGKMFAPSVRSVLRLATGKESGLSKLEGKYLHRCLFHDILEYRISGNAILGISRDIEHNRRFDFGENYIVVEDAISFKSDSPFTVFHPVNLVFYEVERVDEAVFQVGRWGRHFMLHSSIPLSVADETLFSPSGRVFAVRESSYDVCFRRGTTLRRWVRFEFKDD